MFDNTVNIRRRISLKIRILILEGAIAVYVAAIKIYIQAYLSTAKEKQCFSTMFFNCGENEPVRVISICVCKTNDLEQIPGTPTQEKSISNCVLNSFT